MGYAKADNHENDPLPVVVKIDRSGLGSEGDQKERLYQEKNLKKRKVEEEDMSTFAREKKQYFKKRRIIHQIVEIVLKAGAQLDETLPDSNESPIKNYQHIITILTESIPEYEKEIPERILLLDYLEQKTLDECTTMIENLLDYLRTTHTYCYFCGVVYNNNEDMESNCPGTTEEDH
eukprot:TRINITY_DN5695_c0_g1_i1.p1 TRINITY_DN5695_c0_g1~~TRINITY_DN5695_c0_g1_i1.p1  ORF type:complete len:177 (+),score=43.07 TRINITY_DN5695_c0_g1_i1:442-972(+)